MTDELIAELRRQAVASGGKCSLGTEPDTLQFNGVIDLRFLARCLEDQFWNDLTRKLRQLQT